MVYLIGLHVTDDELYSKYREAMFPILQEYGGDFGYDFKIAEVLKSETEKTINRVFTIKFKNEARKNAFFTNKDYLIIKKQYFENAVSAVTEMAKYTK